MAARILTFIGFLLCVTNVSAAVTPFIVTAGQGSTALTGPWKFHTGDDPHWAATGFDDSSWEDVDLTPPPGARDGDVGLPGYVPGWASRGHSGYHGYAWYRVHVTIEANPGVPLALAGPLAVDSAYQLYVNGHLMGGVGDFSASPPAARSNHRPTFFALPAGLVSNGPVVIAVRTWMGTWPSSPDEGGIHVAPVLGTSQAVADQYHLQWLNLFEGYIVDALEGVALVLLAAMALSLIPFDRNSSRFAWLALGLVFLATHRGNQAIMFLGNFETLHEFELIIITLAIPLYMGSWLIAWRAWFALQAPTWLPKAIIGLTAVYVLAAFLTRSWFRAAFPEIVFTALRHVIEAVRYAFLIIYISSAWQGIRHSGREGWYALPAIVTLGVGLYGPELFYLGTPGIWFPFGIGVSLSEIAYALFVPLLVALLVRRLWSFSLSFAAN